MSIQLPPFVPAVISRFCFIALLLSLSGVFSVHARVVESPLNEAGQGSLLLTGNSWQGSKLSPLVKTQVEMSIHGLVARVEVTQDFYNPSQEWVNGVYVFPLPEQAAVDGLSMRVGERIIEGQIQPKAKAKAIFDAAKQQGKKASLVQQLRPNLFTNNIANIGPGEKIRISLRYQQTVQFDNGEFQLRFPMTLTPRYMPGEPVSAYESSQANTGWAVNTSQVSDANQISPLYQHPDAPPASVDIRIHLDAGMPLANVQSPFHPIQVIPNQDGSLEVSLRQTDYANRDFVLVWRGKSEHSVNTVSFQQTRGNEAFGLVMLVPNLHPNNQQETELPGREVVFVLDTSGSMAGESLRQAVSALTSAIMQLSPQDRFNLIEFNSDSRQMWSESVYATGTNKAAAIGFVMALEADGGTEMQPALELALDPENKSRLLRQVVFITDGSVGNEESLMQFIASNLGQSRLFTVGIGSAPNSYFMTEAAEVGRGSFTFIGNTEQVQDKVTALLRKLRHPVLTDIRIAFDGQAEVYPATVPDLYAGEPVLIRYREDSPVTQITVSGRYLGEPWQAELTLESGTKQAEGLDKLWARANIAQLGRERRHHQDASYYNQRMQEVAMHYGLVSEFTSLVAVDVTPTRPDGLSSQDKSVPNPLPKGLHANAIFGTLPQTATSMRWHFYFGLALLMIALAIWRWRVADTAK